MIVLPECLILVAAVALGVMLGLNYLRGVRKPVLNGVHLLLGAAALEGFVTLLHGTPNGATPHGGPMSRVALILFAAAMFSGLTRPLFRRDAPRSAEMVLVAHAGFGALGFVSFMVWAIHA